jgi:beta-alanine degradation protein BauB
LKMDSSMDPMKVASNVYKFINENDRVRVLEVIFKPGDMAKVHHHPEHVVYVLKGGHLKLTSEGNTQELDLKQGSVLFLKEQNHGATNTGNSEIDLLVVELKK